MIKAFDLAKYEDVKQWSDKIALSLTGKTMPADASKPWPDEWISLSELERGENLLLNFLKSLP